MSGRIKNHSDVDKWSSFWLCIPVRETSVTRELALYLYNWDGSNSISSPAIKKYIVLSIIHNAITLPCISKGIG